MVLVSLNKTVVLPFHSPVTPSYISVSGHFTHLLQLPSLVPSVEEKGWSRGCHGIDEQNKILNPSQNPPSVFKIRYVRN
jgi:hypothetical protein